MKQKIEPMQIKKRLPHGAIKAISETTGLSKATICKVLKGKESPKKAIVFNATADYIKEYKTRETEAIQQFQKVINEA